MIQAVIFDSDGVIVDSEPFACLTIKKVLKDLYGISIQKKDVLSLIGTSTTETYRTLARKYHISLDLEKIKPVRRRIYISLVQKRLRMFPGFHRLFRALRRKGFKIALATSGHRYKVRANMKAVHLDLHRFDAIVHGDMVRKEKPYPEIYNKIRKRLRMKPSECVVLEDSPTGILAAKRAGMKIIAVTNSFPAKRLKKAGADLVVKSLTELTVAEIQRLGI